RRPGGGREGRGHGQADRQPPARAADAAPRPGAEEQELTDAPERSSPFSSPVFQAYCTFSDPSTLVGSRLESGPTELASAAHADVAGGRCSVRSNDGGLHEESHLRSRVPEWHAGVRDRRVGPELAKRQSRREGPEALDDGHRLSPRGAGRGG